MGLPGGPSGLPAELVKMVPTLTPLANRSTPARVRSPTASAWRVLAGRPQSTERSAFSGCREWTA